ncbi:hypothetical protein RYX36_023612 [Vicia faba]
MAKIIQLYLFHYKPALHITKSDQALSSSSEDSRSRKTPVESIQDPIATQALKSSARLIRKSTELLKDGCIIALHATDCAAFYVSRQRVKGIGWILDSMPDVSKRDPAAHFLIIFRNKDTIGLRSLVAVGKLLQINRRMEFVFATHSFDVWENWTLESSIYEWRLVNCSNPSAVLDHVYIEVLETSDEDGTVHSLTSYVISYVKFLYDYQATLKQLFQEFDSGNPEAQLASVITRICNAD